jgi:hypothetical protein
MWGKNNIPFLGDIKRKILFFGGKYFFKSASIYMKNIMKTKKITLNELRSLVKQVIKEETDDKIGINLRSLLDAEISIALRNKDIDLSNYKERNSFIDMIEDRISDCDWISMSNGTTFEKTFTPSKKYS